jgi:cytoskeletal protein CcmA (bactofilin family)
MSIWKNIRGEGEEDVVSTPPAPSAAPMPRSTLEPRGRRDGGETVANIGKSITIKGDVTGEEDLVIEGHVEGRIDLKSHHLTIGPNGEILAEISAKQVTIIGRVVGNVSAAERVEICDTGRLEGDLRSPRLLIQEGAVLNGSVSMKKAEAGAGAATQRPAAQAQGSPPKLSDVSKTAS